jgi:hypothetical protein
MRMLDVAGHFDPHIAAEIRRRHGPEIAGAIAPGDSLWRP